MLIGAAWVPSPNSYYRAIGPLTALQGRGHDVMWPTNERGEADVERLARCQLVHIFRRADAETWHAVEELRRRGVPITYDNDDDFHGIPKESPTYKRLGKDGGPRAFAATVNSARQATIMTTTTEALAERYRAAGIERVEVIANSLAPDVPRPRVEHEGVVIGWIAGLDHLADTARIDIAGVLRRIVAKHDNVRVEAIGLDLGLPERYRHDPIVQFEKLPARISGFDIAIAPLADIAWNRARSEIKLKEYAASGVPWLASPVGPYAGLGEAQGGRLVPDDGWFAALDRLVERPQERAELGRRAQAWAVEQTIDRLADRWESVLAEAAGVEPGSRARPTLRLGSGATVRLRTRTPDPQRRDGR